MTILIDAFAAFGFLTSAIAAVVVIGLITQSVWIGHREYRARERFIREASAEVEALTGAPGKTGSEGKTA